MDNTQNLRIRHKHTSFTWTTEAAPGPAHLDPTPLGATLGSSLTRCLGRLGSDSQRGGARGAGDPADSEKGWREAAEACDSRGVGGALRPGAVRRSRPTAPAFTRIPAPFTNQNIGASLED